MVQFTIMSSYVMKINNRLDVDLPYDLSDIDPSIPPGVVAPLSQIELKINVSTVPIIDPCLKIFTLPYSYGRPVYLEFSQKTYTPSTIQDIDLTEIPGFTMVENDNAVDHIMECGHHVKLFGGDTSNICLDVWYEA